MNRPKIFEEAKMAKKKVVSLMGYGNWLLAQTSDMESLIEKVAAVTAETHPSDHKFSESKEFPGTCGDCGWIDPATETDCECPKTLRQHVQLLPDVIMSQIFGIEIQIIEIPIGKKGGRLH